MMRRAPSPSYSTYGSHLPCTAPARHPFRMRLPQAVPPTISQNCQHASKAAAHHGCFYKVWTHIERGAGYSDGCWYTGGRRWPAHPQPWEQVLPIMSGRHKGTMGATAQRCCHQHQFSHLRCSSLFLGHLCGRRLGPLGGQHSFSWCYKLN